MKSPKIFAISKLININKHATQFKRTLLGIAGVCILTGLTACSALPDKYDPTLGLSETALFQKAQTALDEKDYSNAAKFFESFEGRFPLSKLSRQALFNTAYAYHKDGEKELAAQTIQRFIELYPNHEQADYAYYLRGLIYFNDDLGLLGRFAEKNYDERDPQSMRTAYAGFKSLVERFPKSQYTPDALDRMRFIVNALAMHDTKIARYYYQRGAYLAATQRAEMVLSSYERAPAIEEAIFIMAKSYDLLKLDAQSKAARALLLQNFPNSALLKQLNK